MNLGSLLTRVVEAGIAPPLAVWGGVPGLQIDLRASIVIPAGDGTDAALTGILVGRPGVQQVLVLPEDADARWAEIDGLSLAPSSSIVVPGAASEHAGGLHGLVWVIDRLLGPGGCPWDQEQTHESLKKHLLEEAYEVLDAIDSGSLEKLREELGDLLMQPIMHAQMERIEGNWSIDDVAHEIAEKLVRRHPHVFGDIEVAHAEEVLANWDKIKQNEKGGDVPQSILAGVPRGMAALLRAHDISKRAARVGFEWPNFDAVFDKLREEEVELREALDSGDATHIEAEIGDLLFTAVNLARWAKVEPEEALRKMLNRFTDRFMHMEAITRKPLRELSPEEWDALWNESKLKLA